MNIVLCLNHFLPHHVAGTEVYTWALAKSLQRRGYLVRLVIPNYNQDEDDEYEYDGLVVIRYAEPDVADRALITGKRAPVGIEAFKRVIQEIKPDIVHVHEFAGSNGIGIFHLRVLKNLGVKIIFSMHLARYSCFSTTLRYKGQEHCSGKIDVEKCSRCALNKLPISKFTRSLLYNTSKTLYKLNIDTGKLNTSMGTAFSYPFIIANLRKVLHEIAGLSETIITLSEWYKKVLLENGVPGHKITLIKQALPYPAEVPIERYKGSKSIKLIFIGRINALKGLHILLDAIKDLPKDEIVLDIFGAPNDQEYYDYLQASTASYFNIRWKGSLQQADVVNTIAQYDALVLPSAVAEMAPLVIQEAFAAGVPVIGSDVDGIQEYVQEGVNGLLFKFNSITSLRELLRKIISNPETIYFMRNKMPSPPNFEGVVDQTLRVYEQFGSIVLSGINVEKRY